LRENALAQIASASANVDPQMTADWLSTLPSGTSKDRAVMSYIDVLSRSAPESAAPWISNIDNAALRNRQTSLVAQRWLDTDPSAAKTWINQSSLPDDQKQRLTAQRHIP
jgi:hypothetical protein